MYKSGFMLGRFRFWSGKYFLFKKRLSALAEIS